MRNVWSIACLIVFCMSRMLAAEPVTQVDIRAPHFRASITRGGITELQDAGGAVFATGGGTNIFARMHWIDAAGGVPPEGERRQIAEGQQSRLSYGPLDGVKDASLGATYAIDKPTGDLVIEQAARSAKKGLWGVSWSIGNIPSEYAIIVPGRSGVRLDARCPGEVHTFDYPQGWEAQLVIVEGEGRGFYVFADDAAGRYKRLTVRRVTGGWRLEFATINDAPFDALDACDSVRWRLNTYEGDWRIPARRYHQWNIENFKPETVATRRPTWARDIRACIITGMSEPAIEELAGRLDPRQTLLYVYDWREAGYDRDYPDYTRARKEFGPFLTRAHELGFRVMPHVNYFGVDPLNPEYATFRPFHVRSAWGKHEAQWWDWDRADPPIKFAYINPAASAWRQRFVSAMVELCRRFPIDALHLDQTLCIYNDHNGRIGGMNMIAGNLALHRDLRAALPDVALSGEGLNEVTCRYESFAQRHVWGLDHSEGTWNEALLARAHPISSYLFLPHTTIYGYLGMAPPDAGQLYAAWNQAYEHFGVIPTLKVSRQKTEKPLSPFLAQFFDEASFWQKEKLSADPDGPWPRDVAFPFKTGEGDRAARMLDGRFLSGDRVVSQTLFGCNRIRTASSIPGWRVYDNDWIMGMDPARRYAVFGTPRDNAAQHVSSFPSGLIAENVALYPEIAVIHTRAVREVLLDVCAEASLALRGTRWKSQNGPAHQGVLPDDSGARFEPSGDRISAHPPYKHVPPGGMTFARFEIMLPRERRARFTSDIALGKGAAQQARSDGVLFRARAFDGRRELAEEHLQTSEQPTPLSLDLSPFAGQPITLELIVDPGPANNPSFDWAEWIQPRVESEAEVGGALALTPQGEWSAALDRHGAASLSKDRDTLHIQAALPGSVFLLKEPPDAISTPTSLIGWRRFVVVDGNASDGYPRGIPVGPRSSGGISRKALFAHPPPNGTTALHFPMRLPSGPVRFHGYVGIADGSKSKGVVFIVEANGVPLVREPMLPGGWREISCDLRPWAGKAIILSLITDSDGAYDFDWALWGEPELQNF